MSNITLPRATVEQVLETIEDLTRDRLFSAEWAGKHGATITALRAALAQQDEPRNQCGETCERARLCATCAQVLAQQDAPEGSVCARCGALAFDPVLPQQDEPVEPVAYIHRQGNYWDTSERHLTDDEKARGWTEEPLYTAPPPPQRKPLPKHDQHCVDVPGYGLTAVRLARAVKRAHGIKE